MSDVHFLVEQAGCTSCAARIGAALGENATVHEIELDEVADVAAVHLSSSSISEDAVNEVLRQASEGAGHRYRVQPGSWRAGAVGP